MSCEFEPKENHTCPLLSQILNEFSQSILCHTFTLPFPVTLHPHVRHSSPHFLDSENKRIRKCHSPRSSQQHTWLTLPLFQELAKRIIPLHLLVKHFQNTKAKCPAWWHHYRASLPGRPARQVELSSARLGHKSDSSQQHAGSAPFLKGFRWGLLRF